MIGSAMTFTQWVTITSQRVRFSSAIRAISLVEFGAACSLSLKLRSWRVRSSRHHVRRSAGAGCFAAVVDWDAQHESRATGRSHVIRDRVARDEIAAEIPRDPPADGKAD